MLDENHVIPAAYAGNTTAFSHAGVRSSASAAKDQIENSVSGTAAINLKNSLPTPRARPVIIHGTDG